MIHLSVGYVQLYKRLNLAEHYRFSEIEAPLFKNKLNHNKLLVQSADCSA